MVPVRENLEHVRAVLERAGVGRLPCILGVTKGQNPERVREGIAAGLTDVGNNYAQEGERLRAELLGESVRWHFIGHIQSRKVKQLLDYDCVQSLDRLSLAEEFEKRLSRPMDFLIEVNIGREPQKSGIVPEALPDFLEAVARLGRVRVTGIMSLPPPLQPVESRRPFFRELRALCERYQLPTLSAGTSDDYVIACQEGANLIRLGTILFGSRL